MLTLKQVRSQVRAYAPLFMPVALDEALEARRIFRARGLRAGSLVQARRAFLSRVHMLPPRLDLRGALVIDIGANEGNFSAAVLSVAPAARVVAVEPNPEPAERMRQRLGDRVTIVPKAVGRESGVATFNVTREDHNSSLREPRTEHVVGLLNDPGWEVTSRVDVEVTTLDELAGTDDVAAVKIDVQGAELDVLQGGQLALQRTSAVLLEITFFSHYEADTTFGPLHEEMTRQGFELVAMSDPVRTAPEGLFSWADACYARRQAGETPA